MVRVAEFVYKLIFAPPGFASRPTYGFHNMILLFVSVKKKCENVMKSRGFVSLGVKIKLLEYEYSELKIKENLLSYRDDPCWM